MDQSKQMSIHASIVTYLVTHFLFQKFEDSCKGAFAKLSETAGPKQYQNKNQIGKLRLF